MSNEKQIKIFADAHVFDGEFQGSRTFIHGIYSLLARKKEVHVFLGAYDIRNLRNHFDDTSKITFVQYSSTSPLRRYLFDIPAIIRKYGIDYAHFQYFVPPVKSCRYIVTTHDVIFNDYPTEFSAAYRLQKTLLYKYSAQRADLVTTVSEFSKKSIQKHLHIKPGKISVIRNGVPAAFFEQGDREESMAMIRDRYGIEKFILYVSRLEPRKNQSALLAAFLELKLYEQGFHLVFIGSQRLADPAFNDLLSSQPDSIRDFVFIAEKIGDDDLLHFYRATAAFVYPSKGEGFGIPPLEAAAMGVPVICANNSALCDFDFFGEYHFDGNDSSALKEKLSRILLHPPGAEELERLSNLVRERYSWELPAEQFYELLVEDHRLRLNN